MEEPHNGLILGLVTQLTRKLEDAGSTYDGQIREVVKRCKIGGSLLCRDNCKFILHILNDKRLV